MINDLEQIPLGFETDFASTKALTVVSFGAGQESTDIVYRIALDPEFRARFAPGRVVVIGCDTGDEHEDTLEHVEFMREFCAVHALEFIWVQPHMGFHSEAWTTLAGQYRRNNTVGSKLFSRTCTDNLKIGPFYRALAAWISRNYNLPYHPSKLGKTYIPFAAQHGKINVILGFASTEAKRKEKTLKSLSEESTIAKFRRACVEFSFPLIDLDMDRAATQADMRRMGLPVPPPSNCKRCHFRGLVELLWLYRFKRADFDEWVELEANKIAKFAPSCAARGKENHGVYGAKLLPEVIAEAIEKHGHMTDEELHEFRMSHGHCVGNGY